MNKQYLTDDEKRDAIINRDKVADAKFLYGVLTTGIYCLPSCPSRAAKLENMVFFNSSNEAEQAGFRACKRCFKNDKSRYEANIDKITSACRLIAESEKSIPLKALASTVAMSPYYFHRLFKKITGVTPKAYASTIRSDKLRSGLAANSSVTDAIYNSGYNSVGHFYQKADDILGMQPNTYKRGGKNMIIYFAIGECSLGNILVAQSTKGICAIFLGDDPDILIRDLQNKFSAAELIGGDSRFEQVVAQVIGHVENPYKELTLPLDIQGTAFQQQVWDILRQIPPGTTVTYTDIAERMGSPKSVRAVANACGSNSLAVAIPCHRVIRTSGELAGYRWGIKRKRILINREKKHDDY